VHLLLRLHRPKALPRRSMPRLSTMNCASHSEKYVMLPLMTMLVFRAVHEKEVGEVREP